MTNRWRSAAARTGVGMIVGGLLQLAGAVPVSGQETALEETSGAPAPGWRFTPGESFTYSVAIGRFKLGEAWLRVDGIEAIDGRSLAQVTLVVEGGPPFFRIRNRLSSWIEAGSMRSHRFERSIREGPKRYSDRYLLNQESGSYTAERWSEDLESFQPSAAEEGGPMPTGAIDEIALLYLVRTLSLEPGDEHQMDRYFKPRSNPVVVRVLEREEIRVPAGHFQTIVVEPIIPEVGVFQANKKPRVWITDDEQRLIVRVQTSSPVGPVALNLTAYEVGGPGS